MFKSLRLLVIVTASVLILPVTARPQAPPPTLTAEVLVGTSMSGTVECTLSAPGDFGTGSMTFSVSGTAAGPYAGTFTESGRLEIAQFPNTELILTAAFQIVSGSTVITGTKSYTGETQGEIVQCTPEGFFSVISVLDPGFQYDAVIHTPQGSFHDEGAVTQFVLHECGPVGAPCMDHFRQRFESSLLEPEPCKFKDKEGTERDRCKVMKDKGD